MFRLYASIILCHGLLCDLKARSEANPGDTVINGKPLEEWLLKMRSWQIHPSDNKEVSEAISKAGEKAFPIILQSLSKEGYKEPNDRDLESTLTWSNRRNASLALQILGRTAEPLVPKLIQMLQERNWKDRDEVVRAVAEIHSTNRDLVNLAIEDAKSKNPQIRFQGLQILGSAIGSAAAVTALVEATGDEVALVRQAAIEGLGGL